MADDPLRVVDDPWEWPSFGQRCDAQGQVLAPSAQTAPTTPATPTTQPTGHADPVDARDPDAPAPTSPFWASHVALEGMYCAACALTIESALRAVPGVLQADVSAAARRARVVWRADQVRPSQWMAAVQHAGYRAVPARDATARAQRHAQHKQALWRWLLATLCMMQVMMYAWPAYTAQHGDLSGEMETLLRWASWVICMPLVLWCCAPFFRGAWRDLRQRRVGMDLPVALGMALAFGVSTLGTVQPEGIFGREVFFDSLSMFVCFLLTGRWLELRLRDRTAGALDAALHRLPDSVLQRQPDGRWQRVGLRRLAVGDVLQVLPGEAFPADGVVLHGSTHADEALLTGESRPVPKTVGDTVTTGSYNLQAAVQVQVQQLGADTRYAQIVQLMDTAATHKPRWAQLADRMAGPFLGVVLLLAAGAAVYWWPQDPGHALMVAAAVLIVTCPCALSLATPVAMLTAAGTLARHGVLVRNLQALETLAQADRVVLDKTGTLTRDGMAVQGLQRVLGAKALPQAMPDTTLAQLAAAVARHSHHPVARALAAWQPSDGPWQVLSVQEVSGQGLQAQVRGGDQQPVCTVRLGSAAFTGSAVADTAAVYLSAAHGDGHWVPWAHLPLQESLRPEAPAVVAALQAMGLQAQLLSGDAPPAVAQVARAVGVAQLQGACSPADKLAVLQQLQAQGHTVLMVGDGLNDGPVLAGADVAVAFGRAVPLAQARADVVVLGDDLRLLLHTVQLARRTLRVVRQNLAWAALYNAVCVPLALVGWMPAWLAGLGMALSSLWVVANAARLARPLPVLPALPGLSAVSDAADSIVTPHHDSTPLAVATAPWQQA